MGSRWCHVGFGRLSGPSLVAGYKEVHNLSWLLNRVLVDPRQTNALLRVIPKLKVSVLGVWHEQVSDDLVINFNVRYPDVIVVLVISQYLFEKILQYQIHDTWAFIGTCHRKSLTRACGSVGEHASVEALYNGLVEVGACLVIDALGALITRENSIEEVSLFSWSVQDLKLLALVLSFHLIPIHHYL